MVCLLLLFGTASESSRCIIAESLKDFIRKYDLNAFVSKWDDPFSVWSRSVDIVVSPPSTSFYDLLSCGINPICIRDVVPPRENHVITESDDNNPILDYVYRPKSVDEILETINSGKVPDLSKGVEEVLEAQAGISIAKNSISNITTAMRSLTKSRRSAVVKSRCLLPFVYEPFNRRVSTTFPPTITSLTLRDASSFDRKPHRCDRTMIR